jgi:hypothetical protein
MISYTREVSKRVFAQEFRNSDLSFRDGDDIYSPQYLLTPTGARVNRLFIAGTLIETENIGTESEYWRGRVADPTGSFLIYAGQYQPEAARVLAECETPEFVSVVGKPSTFTTPEGNVLTSVRPESVNIIDADTRDRWVLDTALRTVERIASLDSNDQYIAKAREHYNTDPRYYSGMVREALRSLQSEP